MPAYGRGKVAIRFKPDPFFEGLVGTGANLADDKSLYELFRVRANRLVHQHTLSGAHDPRSLTRLLQAIVGLAVETLTGRRQPWGRAFVPAAGFELRYLIGREALVSCSYLGQAGTSVLGESLVLGARAAARVPTALVGLQLPVHVLVEFAETPQMRATMEQVIEDAVPLNLDYRIELRAAPGIGPFRLDRCSRPDKTLEATHGLLGVSTKLLAQRIDPDDGASAAKDAR